jgi:exonuclease III
MTYIYKVATININGISYTSRIRMLEAFLNKQDIDIALLQEVTSTNVNTFRQYTAHINQGTDKRRTVILTEEGLTVRNITRLPSG